MLLFEVSVDAPPPARGDPGICADRDSPNAAPLFAAASARVAEDPDRYPIRTDVLMEVTSATPLPYYNGYGADTAMVEVLVEAGVLDDERLVATERLNVDPLRTGYSLTLQPDQQSRSSLSTSA